MKDAFGVSKAYYEDHDPVVQALNSARSRVDEIRRATSKPAPVKTVTRTVRVIPKGKMAAIAGASAAGGAVAGGTAVALKRKKP